MPTKNRILITINDEDLDLLDKLAGAAENVSTENRNGYRPMVIEQLLEIVRRSGIQPYDFMASEWKLIRQ